MHHHRKKIFITSCMALLGTLFLHAQQEPLYSLYSLNGFLFNPAVAGSDGYTTVSMTARDHMLGFPNSPKTYVLSIQGRLLRRRVEVKGGLLSGEKRTVSKRSGRVGLGAYVFNDRNGLIERTGASFTYAYHVFMQNTQFSMGLAMSTFQFKLAQDELVFRNQGAEPLLNSDLSNQMLVPDVSFGTYVLSPTTFFGFSVDNLFQTRIPLGSQSFDYRMFRHYFLMGGKRFNSEDQFSYEPSFLLKATEKMVAQADLQMRFYYNQDYYLGLCYRTGSSLGLLIGAKWNRIHFGYAFDYGLTSIQKYTYGAHEINISLKLGDSARRYKWLIRY